MKTAFLFPGQGSQYVGMGRQLYDEYAVVRLFFARADEALGEPLSKLIFEGPEEDLKLTCNTQPALLTVSVAVAAVLQELGIGAQVAAGHSLGEYSALVYAGAMEFQDAVRSVRCRGQFMQEAVPVGQGGMAAVLGGEAEAIVRVCRSVEEQTGAVVEAVNFNCPGQVVIAGSGLGVREAVQALKEAGIRRVLPLPVSAPFHSSLMQPAAGRLAQVLDGVQFADAALPVYANVTAVPVQKSMVIKELLVRQAASPVLWEKTVRNMAEDGVDTFVEVGPGRVLSGFVRKIVKGARIFNVEDGASLKKTVNALKGI